MNAKQLDCEKCGRPCSIRTRIKDRESAYYGLKLCGYCKNTVAPTEKKKYTIPKQTAKNKAMKAEKKSIMDPFFEYHQNRIVAINARCFECGSRLHGGRDEVMHVLNKRNYESVRANLDNAIYGCGMHSVNQCHAKFDKNENNTMGLLKFENIKVAVTQFNKFKQLITEEGSEKNVMEELNEIIFGI
jgi:hypothetical protein